MSSRALHLEHLADLRKSGLSDETIGQAGLYSVTPRDIGKITSIKGVISLLAIPYGAEFTRYKVFPTTLKVQGNAFRYTQPYGSGVYLYVPPAVVAMLQNPLTPLWIVEGEKKALKACQEGLTCLAIGGLWNWLEDGRLAPDFKAIDWRGRLVTLCPDSDVWRPKHALLREAVRRLGEALEAEGAVVSICLLSHGPGETKQGLDDFLCTHDTADVQALPQIPHTDRRLQRKGSVKVNSQPGKPKERPQIVTMNDIEAQPISWLWWPYIAVGTLCMLDGDPGIGKSLLTLQLAASLSQGYPLPNQQGKLTLGAGTPQTTLLLSTEDGLAETVKPRLEADGADCSKVHVLTGWLGREDEHHAFTLQHMSVLEAAMRQYRPNLVVIDPIQAYLGDIDMHRANETRPLLEALRRLTDRYRTALVCVRHPSKAQTNGKAMYRGLGSMDFIGAARTGLFAEQHPNDAHRALLSQHKNNIGPLGRTQVFSKAEGRFLWAGVSRITAEMLAGSGRGPDPHTFLALVCRLEESMTPGIPYSSKTLEEELKEDGYGHDVIKRAKKALQIRSVQTPSGWVWTLPFLSSILPTTDSTTTTDSTATTATAEPKTDTYTPVVGIRAVEAEGAVEAVEGYVPRELERRSRNNRLWDRQESS